MKLKKNHFRKTLALITIMALSTVTVLAAGGSWDTASRDFMPDSGDMSAQFNISARTAKTYLAFTYSDADAAAISTYNAGGQYAGMDVKNVPSEYNTGLDMMSAYSITTDLPNPKTDIENDDLLGGRNEEAEAIALGEIVGGEVYYMNVQWEDYRNGGSNDYGQWNVNAELASKFVFDYNTDDWRGCTSLTYGNLPGKP